MKVPKAIIAVCVIFIVCTVTIGNSLAESGKPAAEAQVAVLSKYVWRGFELSKDSLIIQPSLAVSYKGFGMNLWSNLDTKFDDTNPATSDESSLNETDLTLSYGTEFGILSLGAGYVYYGLDGMSDSQELYFSMGANTLLSPTVTIYREVAYTPAWYVSFGISHSFELPKNISLDLGASAGYYYSDDDTFVEIDDSLTPTADKYRSFHDGLLTISLNIPVGEYVTISPNISYSFPLAGKADNLISSSSYDGDSDFFYGGITVSFAF